MNWKRAFGEKPWHFVFKHSILIIHYILYIYNKQTKQDTYRKKTLDPIQCRKIVFYSLKLNMFVFIKYPRFFSLPRKQHEMRIKKDFVKMRRSDIWHCAFILWKNIHTKAAYIYGQMRGNYFVSAMFWKFEQIHLWQLKSPYSFVIL